MSLTDSCKRPFANGTEGRAWMDKWCEHCRHDHDMHTPDGSGPGCGLIANAMLSDHDDYPGAWPEAWLPEPDDGRFFLPSRLVCLHFEPCQPCGGDPGAPARAERIAEVRDYWQAIR